MIESEITSLAEQRLKLDIQEHTLQSLRFTQTTLAAEHRATNAIKAKVKAMGGPEAIEAQRDEADNALEDAYELLGIASQPVSNPALSGVDDEELLAEAGALRIWVWRRVGDPPGLPAILLVGLATGQGFDGPLAAEKVAFS